MEHKIDLEAIGSPQADAMAHAISTCVHCGFCLPACPTYQVLGEEMDSPRGRIVLMRGVLEQNLPLEEATPYLDRCLGCLGCETACPSGVAYGELLSSFRAHTQDKRRRPIADQMARMMASQTLPFPNRFRWAALLGRLAKPIAGIFPTPIRAMLGLVPSRLPDSARLPVFTPAKGVRRGQVAFNKFLHLRSTWLQFESFRKTALTFMYLLVKDVAGHSACIRAMQRWQED